MQSVFVVTHTASEGLRPCLLHTQIESKPKRNKRRADAAALPLPTRPRQPRPYAPPPTRCPSLHRTFAVRCRSGSYLRRLTTLARCKVSSRVSTPPATNNTEKQRPKWRPKWQKARTRDNRTKGRGTSSGRSKQRRKRRTSLRSKGKSRTGSKHRMQPTHPHPRIHRKFRTSTPSWLFELGASEKQNWKISHLHPVLAFRTWRFSRIIKVQSSKLKVQSTSTPSVPHLGCEWQSGAFALV